MKAKRAMGVIVVEPEKEPTGVLALEAKTIQRQKQEERIARAERREARGVPNWIAYKDIVFKVGVNVDETGRWLGGKLPTCRKCEGILHPGENHQCSRFQPKFKEHDKESHERFEARREAIRESRAQLRRIVCSVCGEEIPEPGDAERHWYAHEGKPEREHFAVDGEPDGDLDGDDDEPEDDYCEDDGYDPDCD